MSLTALLQLVSFTFSRRSATAAPPSSCGVCFSPHHETDWHDTDHDFSPRILNTSAVLLTQVRILEYWLLGRVPLVTLRLQCRCRATSNSDWTVLFGPALEVFGSMWCPWHLNLNSTMPSIDLRILVHSGLFLSDSITRLVFFFGNSRAPPHSQQSTATSDLQRTFGLQLAVNPLCWNP